MCGALPEFLLFAFMAWYLEGQTRWTALWKPCLVSLEITWVLHVANMRI